MSLTTEPTTFRPRRFPSFAQPAKAGAGFKPEHLTDILADPSAAGFFEVHAENYMGQGGTPHASLTAIRERFPLSVHGVGLSIGGSGPLDQVHLNRLKTVVDRYEPFVVSEHLAWSTHDTVFYNDLLPVPYTEETLSQVCAHVDEVQSALRRPMLLENPSTYIAFEHSSMSEIEFVSQVAKRTGCGLLLDLNNVLVCATNHNFEASKYLAAFPLQHVGEIHLAGHATDVDDQGNPLLIDAHDREVSQQVWSLYSWVCANHPHIPTLIEWDNDVPAWSVLKSEALAADLIAEQNGKGRLRRAS